MHINNYGRTPAELHRLIDRFGSIDAGAGGSDLPILGGRASTVVFRHRGHAKIRQWAHRGA